MAGCKVIVLDDIGYLMTNVFMTQHRCKKGDKSFEMYNDIADLFWNLIRFIKIQLPPDVIVYLMMHEDTNDYGDTKLKTIGKLLDTKVCIEGMVTICIRCMTKNKDHFFRVATDGNDISKAPEDMFPESEFENNLKYVDTKIREYYGFIGGNENAGTEGI